MHYEVLVVFEQGYCGGRERGGRGERDGEREREREREAKGEYVYVSISYLFKVLFSTLAIQDYLHLSTKSQAR